MDTHTHTHTHVHNSGKRLKRRLFIIPDKALRAMTSTPAKEKLAAYSVLKASEGGGPEDGMRVRVHASVRVRVFDGASCAPCDM